MQKPKLSILSPVYNEELVIAKFLDAITSATKKMPNYHFEIVLVDDGSTDGTVKIVRKINKKMSIVLLRHEENKGQQTAILTGLENIKTKAVIVMDADLQDPPTEIPNLISKWEKGFDFVAARRVKRDDGFVKKMTASIFYRFLKILNPNSILDCGDFYLLDKRLIDVFLKNKPQKLYLRGQLYEAAQNAGFVDIERGGRLDGKSKYTLFKMLRLAKDGIIFSLKDRKK